MIESINRDTTSFLLRIKPQEPSHQEEQKEDGEFVSRRERRNKN